MGLIPGVTVEKIESIQGGMSEFYTPQSSDETMVVKVPANSVDDLFVHKQQTDQLLVVKGSFVLVILYESRLSIYSFNGRNTSGCNYPQRYFTRLN